MHESIPSANRGSAPLKSEAHDASPVFVVGAQRSGTTMLRLMLNHHPRLCVPFESGFIIEFFNKRAEYGDLGCRANVRAIVGDIARSSFVRRGGLIPDIESVLDRNPASFPEVVEAIFRSYADARGKCRWGDKTPSYTTELDVLWDLFPRCQVVHLVRDGRDVALSHRRVSWGISSLPRCADDWRWKSTLAHKMGSVRTGQFLEIRYEDLVLEPRTTLEKVCRFLGEEYHESVEAYHQDAVSNMPADSLRWHSASVSPLDIDKAFAWKRDMSDADRTIFDEIAGHTLELFGYERSKRQYTAATTFRKLYYLTIQKW